MDRQREFSDAEIESIFKAAAEQDSASATPQPEHGLTLPELQQIGSEVGFAPDQIADAAALVHARSTATVRRGVLGLPLSVGRTVDLPRSPTEREWEVLVAELRATFAATGKIKSHGQLRQWTNGNLGAFVEPTASGSRLRLRTRRGDAAASSALGLGGLVAAVFTAATAVVFDAGAAELLGPAMFSATGIGMFALNALRRPRWAREREGQMVIVAGRAVRLLSSPTQDPGSLSAESKP